jgi:hypothetical protein
MFFPMNIPHVTEQIVPTLKSFYSVLASLMFAEVEFAFTNLHFRCAEHVVCLLVAAEVFLKLEGPMAQVALVWLLVSLGMATVKHRLGRLVLRAEITRVDGDPPRSLPSLM